MFKLYVKVLQTFYKHFIISPIPIYKSTKLVDTFVGNKIITLLVPNVRKVIVKYVYCIYRHTFIK